MINEILHIPLITWLACFGALSFVLVVSIGIGHLIELLERRREEKRDSNDN